MQIQAIQPSPLVVGRRPVAVTVTVSSHDPTVTLRAQPRNAAAPIKDFTGTHNGDVWTFHDTIYPTDPLGAWQFTAVSTDAAQMSATRTVTPLVVQASRFFDFDVHPRLVRKGHKIYFSGRVGHTVNGRWQWLANAYVNIVVQEHRKDPRTVITVTTDGRGTFYASYPATPRASTSRTSSSPKSSTSPPRSPATSS